MSTGIDIGRSGVKIASGGQRLGIFPAVACVARPIEEAAEAQRAAAQTLDHAGRSWFWGETAQIHGRVQPGNDAGFETSEAYAVILQAAVAQARGAGMPLGRVVLGVPSDAGASVRSVVSQRLKELLPQSLLRVVAQPAGVLAAVAARRLEVLQQTVAIVDVGRYSTDVAIAVRGRPVAGSLLSLPGVRVAVESLAALLRRRAVGTIGFETLESALLSGQIMHRLQRLDVQAEARQARQPLQASVLEAVARIQALQPDVQTLILSGGGVDLLDGNGLPAYEQAPGGRYAVADGLSHVAAGL
jgi:actin-like ATPase involved in cell morphogenesis